MSAVSRDESSQLRRCNESSSTACALSFIFFTLKVTLLWFIMLYFLLLIRKVNGVTFYRWRCMQLYFS